ncbi:MAG: restriction endonuclease subunit S, partial [Desulfurococcus sp.]|uniref:restriction endonuclease subunit S n=1 Tax=Desulfurococcus sp. TaxID=51678 RepID=UPI00317EFDF4
THDGEFVLLAEDGGFFGPYEKSAYIMRGKIWANNHVHVLKAIEGRATNEFLMFYLNFMDLRPFLTGSTRPKITQKDMLRIPIPLPPLSEQKVIAEILSTVDSAIDRVRRLVERADKIKKGLMQELFTKGIGHKEYKETPIGKMPKDWRLERLSNISSEIKAGGTPLRSRREYWNGDIPFVKIEDMTNSFKYLLTISETITKEGLENSNAWLVPENSLLLAIYGSLGEVVINKIKVTTNQAILAIIPRNPKDVEYLYYWFLYYKPNWKKYAKPTTQPNLTKEIVENTLLPYPPSSEREKIAEILSTVDEYIRVLRVKLERLEHVKKWLMDVLLTGKVRVIVEPS